MARLALKLAKTLEKHVVSYLTAPQIMEDNMSFKRTPELKLTAEPTYSIIVHNPQIVVLFMNKEAAKEEPMFISTLGTLVSICLLVSVSACLNPNTLTAISTGLELLGQFKI